MKFAARAPECSDDGCTVELLTQWEHPDEPDSPALAISEAIGEEVCPTHPWMPWTLTVRGDELTIEYCCSEFMALWWPRVPRQVET